MDFTAQLKISYYRSNHPWRTVCPRIHTVLVPLVVALHTHQLRTMTDAALPGATAPVATIVSAPLTEAVTTMIVMAMAVARPLVRV